MRFSSPHDLTDTGAAARSSPIPAAATDPDHGRPLAVGDCPGLLERLEGAWPNLRLVHLPIHASWLNQVEIYFSIVQRKVLTLNDFPDLAEVERRLLGFQRRYQQTAVPFDWRYTRADLAKLLRRLDEHEHRATAA